MKKYKVYVERYLNNTSFIEVEASNHDEAEDLVANEIITNALRHDEVEWFDEPTYEPGTFQTTGDVDDSEKQHDK